MWDPALGAGRRLPINLALTVDVFEAANLTRVATPDIRLELFGPARPHRAGERVVYDQTSPTGILHLGIDRDGTLVLQRSAHPVASHPEPVSREADASPAPVAPPPQDQPETRQQCPTPPDASANREAREEAERVKLTGRLGRAPTFRTSPRGTLVGRFPLAVHREDGTTVWHSILAFGSRTEQLRTRAAAGDLAKGREVDIVGYPHTRQVPGKDGSIRTVTEIHAAAMVKRS